MKHASSLLLALPMVSGCETAAKPEEGAEPVTEAAAVRTIELPASALAGAVRALETLDAVRPAGALAQVRALEGDTLIDHRAGVETVRVLLHLTVYADSSGAARAAFDELRLALETEGRSTARVEAASSERVGRVMAELDWDPPGREDLVSVSEVVRLQVAPGRTSQEPPAELASGPPAYDTLASWMQRVAAEQKIGAVELAVSPTGFARGVGDHRFSIRERPESARHTLAEIGAFLSALENDSPVARLTKVKIERSQHEPDIHAARGWTFEAELSLRALDETVPGAAVASGASTQR